MSESGLLNFVCLFLPILLDTGLQVWNGININSTIFARTENWRNGTLIEDIVLEKSIPQYNTDSAINFPDPEIADKDEDLFWRSGEFCPEPFFACSNGEMCLLEDKVCDGVSDCPTWEGGPGGEDEDDSEGSGYEEGGLCSPKKTTPKPPTPSIRKDLIQIGFILVSLETIVSLCLLQLPAVFLALYGIFIALRQKSHKDKILDSLCSVLHVCIPFCLVEMFVSLTAGRGIKIKGLLWFLPIKDPTGRDRVLSVESCKLLWGSCLQLCFQAVLLGGFTSVEDIKISQIISIVSSFFTVTKIGIAVVTYERSKGKKEEADRTMCDRITGWLRSQIPVLKQFVKTLPLVVPSIVFHTGTLILAILILEWFSAIYVGIVLSLNLALSFLLPFSAVRKTEEKLDLTYKFSMCDSEAEERKVKDHKIVRGIFSSWANLFLILRPVESMSYHKVSHMCLLQPARFLINVITLIILIILTWTPVYFHSHHNFYVSGLKVGLTIVSVVVFVAGIFSQLEVICYFYYGNVFFLSKKPPQKDDIEMQTVHKEENKNENKKDESAIKSEVLKDVNDPQNVLTVETVKTTDMSEEEEEKKPLLDQNKSIGEKGTRDEMEKEDEKEKTLNKEDTTLREEELKGQGDEKEESVLEKSECEDSQETNEENLKEGDKEQAAHQEEKEEDTSNTDREDTEEEGTEASGDENGSYHVPKLNVSSSDTSGIVNKGLKAPQLMTQASQVSVKSMDGSCFFNEEDLEIVDANSTLTKEDVKQTINDIQEQGGKVNKEKFIGTMMDFFPLYNIEENKNKLDKLFDRLDKHNERLITFRQFMLVTIAFSSVSLKDKITRIFKLIDENDDEELTYEEFEEIVKDILVLKEERKISQTQVEERFSRNTFRDMGMNAEGKVKLASFVEACTRQKFIIINYVENFRDGFLVNNLQ